MRGNRIHVELNLFLVRKDDNDYEEQCYHPSIEAREIEQQFDERNKNGKEECPLKYYQYLSYTLRVSFALLSHSLPSIT